MNPQQLRIEAGSLQQNVNSSFTQIIGAYHIAYYSSYKPNANSNWNHDLAIVKVS